MATPGQDQKGKKLTTSSTDRLPSLKGKRDLTLGGVKKKTFTPTIPVRRPKPEASRPSQATPTQTPPTQKDTKTPKSDKKRRPKEVITSASVFSMGPADNTNRGQRSNNNSVGRSGERGQSDRGQRSNDNSVGRSGERGQSYRGQRSNTNSVGRSGERGQSDRGQSPIQLPLDVNNELTARELFVSKIEGTKEQFLFLQLTDRLPIEIRDNSMTTPTQSGLLKDVPEGQIGTLQVHQSGKVTILFGDTTFDVSMATRGGSLQELVSIRTSEDNVSSMNILGQVLHRLNCVPDFSSLGLHGNDEFEGDYE